MGVGHLPIPIIYFLVRVEWSKRNKPSDRSNTTIDKVMLLTWENKFDWKSLWVCIALAITQMAAYVATILPFMASRRSGLNIGIIEALWSISPFFVAFTEWVLFRVRIKLYQFLGMLGLAVMAILISLSDLFSLEAKELEINGVLEKKYPIYKAVLLGLLYPIVVVLAV